MVVLSAAVVSPDGKAILARQFVPMSRLRIEGLLAAFPKLIDAKSQHTFIETDNVRYVYQPLDKLFLVLITNKQSNIMGDLDSLKTIAQLIPEYCGKRDESSIRDHSFELIFAFDEVISLGHKENVTLQQIRTFTTMDSHEEKLQDIIQQSKIQEAKQRMKDASRDIDRKKKDAMRAQKAASRGYPGSRGIGGGSSNGSSFGRNSGGSGSSSYDRPREDPIPRRQSSKKKTSSSNRKKGFQLGKKKTKQSSVSDRFTEELAASGAIDTSPAPRGFGDDDAPEELEAGEGVALQFKERLSVAMDRDGGINKCQVNGELELCVGDPDFARIVIHTEGFKAAKSAGFTFRPHPKIDRGAFNKGGVLALKDKKKAYPVGSDSKQLILKWRLSKGDESHIPITLNPWAENEGDHSVVTLEYTLDNEDLQLRNVMVIIPCPGNRDEPEVTDGDASQVVFNRHDGTIVWHIGDVSADNGNGNLEFRIPQIDEDAFFPIEVNFATDSLYSGLTATDVTQVDDGGPVEYEARSTLEVDSFTYSIE